ncbi:MAG: sugar phosphate isomerase/epimerase [Anaerolineae bacterium]|nr:sugar phosphate isomerase/epimerase [Anaerolineae bacterium]
MELCLYGGPQANASLDSLIRAAAQAGFKCLNLWVSGLEAALAMHSVSWLDDLFQTHALYPAAISGRESLYLTPGSDLALFQSHMIDLCARLDSLGGGIVVVCLGAPASKLKATSELVPALQRLSDLAAPFDVRIAAMPYPAIDHPSNFLTQLQEKIMLSNRSNLGIALNVAHLGLDDQELHELDNLAIQKLWLVDLQVIDEQNQPMAKKICHLLAGKGFQGLYSVELVCQGIQLEKAVQATRQTALALFQPQAGTVSTEPL